jgi:hypothetical protein
MFISTTLLVTGAAILRKLREDQRRRAERGGGRLPPSFQYRVYAVPPAGVGRFLREHDDVVEAGELHRALVEQDFPDGAAKLAADIRRLRAEFPGCHVLCTDFRLP